ncbi:hypothetical protein [Cryobacterium sp. GrIS_2_6]|uniref:hypothetical protein n=1 Tax=Cryobacterium sp. GrIS_2_6 TaxID=3162785 RepID=UPI002E0624A9|nr:hypothetical protein [Cryobacterium psychrotolerans]MEC5149282.1 hypothetical protein [Cryobacterium psychrotolerans]MEC5149361.1 hypothetical protein [Cryobacterium psychrotolerans]
MTALDRWSNLAPAPIAYDIPGAARAIGQSVDTIKKAIAANTLTPRFRNSKPMILHSDLLEWAETAPLDKPEPLQK